MESHGHSRPWINESEGLNEYGLILYNLPLMNDSHLGRNRADFIRTLQNGISRQVDVLSLTEDFSFVRKKLLLFFRNPPPTLLHPEKWCEEFNHFISQWVFLPLKIAYPARPWTVTGEIQVVGFTWHEKLLCLQAGYDTEFVPVNDRRCLCRIWKIRSSIWLWTIIILLIMWVTFIWESTLSWANIAKSVSHTGTTEKVGGGSLQQRFCSLEGGLWARICGVGPGLQFPSWLRGQSRISGLRHGDEEPRQGLHIWRTRWKPIDGWCNWWELCYWELGKIEWD